MKYAGRSYVAMIYKHCICMNMCRNRQKFKHLYFKKLYDPVCGFIGVEVSAQPTSHNAVNNLLCRMYNDGLFIIRVGFEKFITDAYNTQYNLRTLLREEFTSTGREFTRNSATYYIYRRRAISVEAQILRSVTTFVDYIANK